jgi:hypothetical protein
MRVLPRPLLLTPTPSRLCPWAGQRVPIQNIKHFKKLVSLKGLIGEPRRKRNLILLEPWSNEDGDSSEAE